MSFSEHPQKPWQCPDCTLSSFDDQQQLYVFSCRRTNKRYVLALSSSSDEPITFAQCTYGEREDETRVCINRVRPYVDKVVLIHDGSLSSAFMDWAHDEMKCELYYCPWQDDFPAYRNEYLKYIKEGWVACSDPDEVYSESLTKNLHAIVGMSMGGRRFNAVKINSHGTTIKSDGTRDESKSTFYKLLIYKWYPGIHYVGIGHGSVHEDLVGVDWKPIVLPDEYFYDHIKKAEDVWQRAFRNFAIAGGGNNLGDGNPVFVEYRELVKQVNPDLLSWTNMREYLRNGNIDQRLKDFLIKHRNRNVISDADSELRESFRYYFEVLHPEENTGNWKSEPDKAPELSDQDIRGWVEKCYLNILGRHAEEGGKVAYTEHIKAGRLRKEDLPLVLMQSEEFQMLRRSKDLAQELMKQPHNTDLYAFDCDGTLEASNGPVKIETLDQLVSKGHAVVIVSSSGACQGLWSRFPYIPGGATSSDQRTQALLEAKQKFPSCVHYFYVSDNAGDDVRSQQAGFTYIHPNDFYMKLQLLMKEQSE